MRKEGERARVLFIQSLPEKWMPRKAMIGLRLSVRKLLSETVPIRTFGMIFVDPGKSVWSDKHLRPTAPRKDFCLSALNCSIVLMGTCLDVADTQPLHIRRGHFIGKHTGRGNSGVTKEGHKYSAAFSSCLRWVVQSGMLWRRKDLTNTICFSCLSWLLPRCSIVIRHLWVLPAQMTEKQEREFLWLMTNWLKHFQEPERLLRELFIHFFQKQLPVKNNLT